MHPRVGDRRRPLEEPRVQVLPRAEALARERVPLHVLHARLHLALRLRAIGPVGPRREAVERREVSIGRMPHHSVAPALGVTSVVKDYRSRVVHYDLGRHAAEMLERVLVALEYQAHARAGMPPGMSGASSLTCTRRGARSPRRRRPRHGTARSRPAPIAQAPFRSAPSRGSTAPPRTAAE